jgi:hypothetical protein
MRTRFFAAVLAAFYIGTASADDKVDYQKLAESATWEWHPERAAVLFSALNAPKEYTVEMERPKDSFGQITIRFLQESKTLLTVQGHAYTTFVIDGGVLYYADYNHSATGCALVAYDLKNQKQLWKTDLEGIGPISHTRYSNRVTVDLVPDAILVTGDESAGKYIEYVDRTSGKTVGHKLFEKGFKDE